MNYCTYFDKNFLVQGLACIHTLKKYNDKSFFYILALDRETKLKLQNLKLTNVNVIDLSLLFEIFTILRKGQKRNLSEFYYLLTPFLIFYILNYKKKKHVIYVDADLIFFSEFVKTKITALLKKNDILFSVHDLKKDFSSAGKYNVGFLVFKNKLIVLKQLYIWMKQCMISTTINESFSNVICGDQKYIENWGQNKKLNFSAIKIKNFNIGGWNINEKKILKKNGKLICNNSILYFIHANFIKLYINKGYFMTSSSVINSSRKIYNYEIKKVFVEVCRFYKIQIYNNYKKFFNINYLVKRFLIRNLFDLNAKH